MLDAASKKLTSVGVIVNPAADIFPVNVTAPEILNGPDKVVVPDIVVVPDKFAVPAIVVVCPTGILNPPLQLVKPEKLAVPASPLKNTEEPATFQNPQLVFDVFQYQYLVLSKYLYHTCCPPFPVEPKTPLFNCMFPAVIV